MLHIAVKMLETKNLRLWVGRTFLAIRDRMAKVATCDGSIFLNDVTLWSKPVLRLDFEFPNLAQRRVTLHGEHKLGHE